MTNKFKQKPALAMIAFIGALSAGSVNAEIGFNHKGITKTWSEANVRLRVGGRFHYDGVTSGTEIASSNGEVRRARIDTALNVGENIKFKLDRDFANGRAGWRNAWAQYRSGDWRVKAGQFVTPFSIEEIMESNNLAFTERALTSALAPSFRTGIAATRRGRSWSATGAIMANPIGNGSRSDDGVSLVGRGVYNPLRTKHDVVHLAGAIEYRNLDNNATTRLQSGHEVSLRDRRLLRTERIRDAQSYLNANVEAAYKTERFLVQSQAIVRQTRAPETNPLSTSGHIQVSYLFGPAKRSYGRSLGSFGSVQPKSKWGVIEGSARISRLNLRDTQGVVGNETAVTTGVSWYTNRNLRFTVSSTFSDIDNVRRQEYTSGFTHQARLQVAF